MLIIAPGYFLTWHTHGTWLHGDAAGSVDSMQNTFGASRLAPSDERVDLTKAWMAADPFTLTPRGREVVDAIMREHCRRREWSLLALNVRSNHVHVVIGEPRVRSEPIVKQLKEWGTRVLRAHGLAGPAQSVWADHASTMYLYEPGSVEKQVHCTLNLQDNPLPGHGREP